MLRNVPGINTEGVSSSYENNTYDEIQELTESGNDGTSDPTSPSGHSGGCYMELKERDPVIPSVYTALEEAVEDRAVQ